MQHLIHEDETLARIIQQETERQQTTLSLVASESLAPPLIQELAGSILTNRSIEGYPRKRYFAGCEFIDALEELAVERAKELFGAEHANVQAHCGSNANLAVYLAVLTPGDNILAMVLTAGGHLTHGHSLSISGHVYRFIHYGVNRETELLDYEQARRLARKHQPKLIVAGSSSYSRLIDWQKLRSIADEVSAFLLADVAHTSGLIAAKVIPNPVPYADFVTSSCYKTLQGPRGGFILCKKDFGPKIDRAVFPGYQSAAILNLIAAKAACFKRAMTPEFIAMQHQIVKNAHALAGDLKMEGFRLVTNGTDNHRMLVDLRNKGLKGNEAEEALEEIGIILNRNLIPYDVESPLITSGIRIGTTVVTNRGMKEEEMHLIAKIISDMLNNIGVVEVQSTLKDKVFSLCQHFPIPGYRFGRLPFRLQTLGIML